MAAQDRDCSAPDAEASGSNAAEAPASASRRLHCSEIPARPRPSPQLPVEPFATCQKVRRIIRLLQTAAPECLNPPPRAKYRDFADEAGNRGYKSDRGPSLSGFPA